DGAVTTMALTVVSFVLAVVIGLTVCLCRVSGLPVISKAATYYIEIIRGTPLLLQLFYIYYALPDVGIRLPAFHAGVAGLSLHFCAHLAPLFPAGLHSLEAGPPAAPRGLPAHARPP